METVRVLFFPASGPGVGGGHVLRGLALAAALTERGAVCGFAVEAEGARLLARFGAGLGVETLTRGAPLAPTGLTETAAAWRADAIVVDDYRLSAEGESGLATPSRPLIVIDDLADRPHLATLLIDPSHGRAPFDYAHLLPLGARVLGGAAYALLRPSFADASPIAVRAKVERIFIGFGLADPGGVTLRVVRTLLATLPQARLDVVIGAGGDSLPGLRALAERQSRMVLHVETDDVAALMGQADMAVGAGGASTWERLRLGLPSLCVIVADNQRTLSRDLAEQGFQLALEADAPDFEETISAMALALTDDEARRRRLSQAGCGLCDGQGARRVAEAVLQTVAAHRS